MMRHSVMMARQAARPIAGLLLAAVVMLAQPAPAHADFASGLAAYEAGDFAAAAAAWRPLAEGGDPAAMRNLGHLYRWGRGVPQDMAEALRWYRSASERGFARAQANLAALYLNGEGVAVDYAEAHKWFEAAAKQGHAVAQYNLGLMYELGLGVPANPGAALGWYNNAAKAGQPDALERLSLLVLKQPKPEVQAVKPAAATEAAPAQAKSVDDSSQVAAAAPVVPPPAAAPPPAPAAAPPAPPAPAPVVAPVVEATPLPVAVAPAPTAVVPASVPPPPVPPPAPVVAAAPIPAQAPAQAPAEPSRLLGQRFITAEPQAAVAAAPLSAPVPAPEPSQAASAAAMAPAATEAVAAANTPAAPVITPPVESGGLFGWLFRRQETAAPAVVSAATPGQAAVESQVEAAPAPVQLPARAPTAAAAPPAAAIAAAPPPPDPMQVGQQAYDNGDYFTALARWLPLAQQGNAQAQGRLGLLYRDGRGLPPDRVRALAWLRVAADNGNGDAEQAAANLAQGMSDRQRDDAANLAARLRGAR